MIAMGDVVQLRRSPQTVIAPPAMDGMNAFLCAACRQTRFYGQPTTSLDDVNDRVHCGACQGSTWTLERPA